MDGSTLTSFALIFMVVSMGAVTALAVYCYCRILWGSKKWGDESRSRSSTPPVVM